MTQPPEQQQPSYQWTPPGDPQPVFDSAFRQQPSQAKPRRARTVLAAASLAALVGGGVGAGTVAVLDRPASNPSAVSGGITVTTQTAANTAVLDGTVTAAAARIEPSVVTINVTTTSGAGTGSGVIVRGDGYILTNNHVVSLAASGGELSVQTNDGRTQPATVVGTDPSDDLAVIKINRTGLTAATFAKSSSLRVGQTVVAVGAPLGLSDTVTSGIVSTLGRPVRAGDNNESVFNAVQTDAAINPGNSGGPLVDLNGQVVGINAAIATDSSGGGLQVPGQTTQSGSIGIGFAIPADEASRIAGELIATGKATHALLGVSVRGAGTGGATLSAVTAGGAAARAGLQAGDVVTSAGGQRIETGDGLIAAIRSHAPNEQVAITYLRSGTTRTVTVTLTTSSA